MRSSKTKELINDMAWCKYFVIQHGTNQISAVYLITTVQNTQT